MILTYQYLEGKTLVFMYDPFKPVLLDEVFKRINEQCKADPNKEIYLVYVRSFNALPVIQSCEFITLINLDSSVNRAAVN